MSNELKLINMNDVQVEPVDWLWYPYIPYGKITILQGDGGDGKTTAVLAIAAAVTKGLILPETSVAVTPGNVIFQTAEDGLGDTVKPRLLLSGADCSRIEVIDESEKELTLSDVRIEKAIIETNAKLFIVDPLQAYLGADVDMHRANEVRPVLKRIARIAAQNCCAVVIVGHLNKGGNKSQYRGLGSIDIQSAARSVLTLGRINEQPNLRAFAHAKSNLAPEGSSIAFEMNPDTGFRWVGKYDITLDALLNSNGNCIMRETTYSRALDFLKSRLSSSTIPATEIYDLAARENISKRTLNEAKSALEVKSVKQNSKWYWVLPGCEQGCNTSKS